MRISTCVFRVALLVTALIFAPLVTAQQQKLQYVAPNRMVVLDYSGSMKYPNNSGIEQIFPHALETALRLTGSSATGSTSDNTGLIVFGHNFGRVGSISSVTGRVLTEAESCRDIAEEVQYGPLDDNRKSRLDWVSSLLKGRIPEGETPLKQALALAAERLSDGGSIILVTDADDSICGLREGADPCQIVSELRSTFVEKGIVVTHIVAVPLKDGNVAFGTRRLAECTEANLVPLFSKLDVDSIVEVINSNLEERARAPKESEVLSEVTLSRNLVVNAVFLNNPVVIPYGEITGEIQQGDTVDTFNIYENPLNVSLQNDSANITGIIDGRTVANERVSSFSANKSIELKFEASPVTLTLVDNDYAPLSMDNTVEWTFIGAGTRTERVDRPSIRVNGLPFEHKVVAKVNGVVVTGQFTPNADGTVENVRLIVKLPVLGPATLRSLFSLPREVLFAEVWREMELVLEANDGTIHSIPLIAEGESLKLRASDYRMTFSNEESRILVGTLTVENGQTIELNGQLPVGVIEAKLSPPTGKRLLWTVRNEHGKVEEMSGLFFRRRVPPGEYTLEVNIGGAVRKSEFSIPATGGLQSAEIRNLELERDSSSMSRFKYAYNAGTPEDIKDAKKILEREITAGNTEALIIAGTLIGGPESKPGFFHSERDDLRAIELWRDACKAGAKVAAVEALNYLRDALEFEGELHGALLSANDTLINETIPFTINQCSS